MDATFEELVELGIRDAPQAANLGKYARQLSLISQLARRSRRRTIPAGPKRILSGLEKKSAQPYWQRALKAQVHQPSWNPKQTWLQNILANIRQTHSRGQQMVTAEDMLRDWHSSMDPNFRFQRAQQFLQSGDPVVTNPLDRLLYRPIGW